MGDLLRLHLGGHVADKSVTGFHVRMVRIATGVAWVTIVATAISVFVRAPNDAEHGRAVVLALLVTAAACNVLAYALPWQRLIERYGAQSIFRIWSLALFTFCALIIYSTPELDGKLHLLYFPVILFVIATLDRRGQAVMSVVAMLSYAVAAQLSTGVGLGDMLFQLVSLGLVAFLGSYITGEQRETALENARLYEESHRAHEELRRVFNRFGKALASSLDLDKTLQLITDLAVEIVGTDSALLVLVDQQGEGQLEGASGPRQDDLRHLLQQAGDWLVSGIVRSRAAVQVPDMAADDRFAAIAAGDCKVDGSYLGVPLLLRGRVIGVLSVYRANPARYPASEVELLASFANQAAVAIENARLFAVLQERLRELSGLHEISLAFASLTKLEDTYGQLVERIARLLDAERCVILLPDDEDRCLVAQAPAYGLSAELVSTMRIPIAERSAAARVWLSGRPYLTNDAQTDPRNVHRWARAFGDRSLVIVPMRVAGKTVGLLRASNKRSDRFTNNDVRLLTIFATQAAVALRNAMLYREVAYQRARLEAIFDNASDGIMIVDHTGVIVAYNGAMETISGYQASEAMGARCWDICQARDERGRSLCDLTCPIRSVSPSRREVTSYDEHCIVTKEGHQRDVGVSYSFLSSPEGEHYGIAIMRDISRAKELERVKTQFISTVSHELRTPLASIKASIGLLLTSMPPDLPEPLMRLLHNIERSGRRLESLVSDLLDLTRLQSGRVRLTPRRVDLREVISAAAATIRPLVEEKGQQLEIELPGAACYVMGDRQRLEQALLNLLSNAHKYTPAAGRISITLARLAADTVAPGKDGSWRIAVRDTGSGIPREEQEHIFERFYRVEAPDTQFNVGTGLGLPIAKALVDLHGGRIWLESEQGSGSVFYIALPEEGNSEDTGS